MTKKLSRIVALMLAVIMSFSMLLVPVEAASFKDVSNKAWYKAAVDYVAERGWMSGVSSTTFAPNMKVTRGMAVTVLAKVAEADLSAYEPAFADTEAGKWYTKAAAWAADKGIVAGVGDGMFAPNRVITRQDLAAILNKFIKKQDYQIKLGEPVSFNDMDSVAGYATQAVSFCAAAGLVSGFEDSTFRPQQTATRAQLAVMMMKLDELRQGYAQPMPAQSFNGAAGEDMSIAVNAPEGALPENSTMSTSRVTDEAALAAIQAQISGEVLAAADITFSKNGAELEPEAAVEVQIALDGLDSVANPKVVHVKADGTVEYVNAELISVTRGGEKALRFEAKDFSVYAVIDDPDHPSEDARLFVTFKQASGADIVIPVKKTDMRVETINGVEVNHFEQVLYDPGVGTLTGRQTFFGWTDKENFTEADTEHGKTIADIRTDVATLLNNGVYDGQPQVYYPMIYDVYSVTYVDEIGAGIKTDSILVKSGSTKAYTIEESYDPLDTDSRFEGWGIASKNADGNWVLPDEASMTKYEVGATLTFGTTTGALNNDLVLRAFVPSGHWLIFKENGQNASFTPAAFYRNDVTEAPTAPTRFGYTFGGWYLEKECNNAFTFGQQLTETIHLYAKWNPVTQANYTVIIWTENIACDGYDFKEVVTVQNATVGQNTNVTGQANATSVSINGNSRSYTGFHLKAAATNVPVKPEGDTVVDVYFDRNEYTFTFEANANGYFTYNRNLDAYEASSPRTTIHTVTRKYDQDISDIWDFTGSNGVSYPEENENTSWLPTNSSTYTARITSMQRMPAENITFRLLHTDRTTRYFHYYIEVPDGETGTRTFQNLQFNLYKDLPNDFNVVYYNDDFWLLKGFTRLAIAKSNDATVNLNAGGNISWQNLNNNYGGTNNHLYFYYTRVQYPINFMDGKYVDGDGVEITEGVTDRGSIHQSANIDYEADITSYNKGGANYYKAEDKTPQGFTLAGWYLDKSCTVEYPFSKMPLDGVTVYAKWVRIQYRVFLYPNAVNEDPQTHVKTNDPTFESGEQGTCFRIDWGEELTINQMIRDAYNFSGWYTDPSLDRQYAFSISSFAANDEKVKTAYDQTESTERDYYGDVKPNMENTNSDAQKGRFWITRKLELYGKWREKLIGTDGITVVYESGTDGQFADGSTSFTDPLRYEDTASAVAQGASTATTEGLEFKTWVLYEWNGSAFVPTNTKVLPGKYFDIHSYQAQIIDNETGNVVPAGTTLDADGSYTYTIKLVAEYGSIEAPTPTFIKWFANNTTDGVQENLGIGINQGITIPTTETWVNTNTKDGETLVYPGHEFLGWARLITVPQENGKAKVYRNAELTDEVEVDDFGVLKLDPETDLFVKWVEASGEGENAVAAHFEAKNEKTGEWVTVQQVACDENQPYHDMYAVWKSDVFYVFHSSTGTLDAYSLPISEGSASSASSMIGSFDLTAIVEPGYLYGGYYSTYGGVDTEAVKNATKTLGSSDWGEGSFLSDRWTQYGKLASDKIDTNFVNYDGSSVKNGTKRFWTKADAYNADSLPEGMTAADVNGKTMKPVGDTIYYLKEVPDLYLHSYYAFVLKVAQGGTQPTPGSDDTLSVDAIYLLSVVDDRNYATTGVRTGNDYAAAVADNNEIMDRDAIAGSFTLVQEGIHDNTPTTTTKTAADLCGQRGYISINQLETVPSGSFVMVPSWKTLDGVVVGNAPLNLTVATNNVTSQAVEVNEETDNYVYVNFDYHPWWLSSDSITKIEAYYPNGGNVWDVPYEMIPGTSIMRFEKPEGTSSFRVMRFQNNNGETGTFWNKSVSITFKSGSTQENFVASFKSLDQNGGDGTDNDEVTWKIYIP